MFKDIMLSRSNYIIIFLNQPFTNLGLYQLIILNKIHQGATGNNNTTKCIRCYLS